MYLLFILIYLRAEKNQTKYCSLDIETSNFDAAEGDILEVGIVIFEISGGKTRIIQEWDSVFKPAKEVPARILALTGITAEEMENAPAFRDKSDDIQNLVRDCIIVGHNISFDIRFLEAYGIKFSGKKIDTLDLAQIFLPTFASYNLEAVVNFFRVEHRSAHRALADSKASLQILEKLLGINCSLPEELRKEIRALFESTDPVFLELLKEEMPPHVAEDRAAPLEISQSAEITQALQESGQIITFPLGFDYQNYVYGGLSKLKEKTLLVVPNKKILCRLWQYKLVSPVFEDVDVFSPERFEKLLKKRAQFPPEISIFLAKIMVWRHLNWQTQTLLDLNFSFFGNQYRALVSCEGDNGAWPFPKKEKIVAMEYSLFISPQWREEYGSRKIIILDINNFENALTYIASKKISWNDYIYAVKQICDPVLGTGSVALRETSSQALAEIDLFFGLASMNFKKMNPEAAHILLDASAANSDAYKNIERLSGNFIEKMAKFNARLGSEGINRLNSELLNFFVPRENQIKWVEIYEARLVFHSSPLDLAKLADQTLGSRENILFTASLGSNALVQYFIARLALKNFSVKNIGQQELRKKLEVHIRTDIGQEPAKILDLAEEIGCPAAVIMPSSNFIREFYEANFKTLQKKFKVFAQGFSGGPTKMLDNFSIHENSLLLATDRFIARQIHKNLKVKSLVITRLPFDQFTHPLFAAQAQKYKNQFIEFNIPRALYNFHTLIRFFYGHDLEKIYITDPKIRKDYGQYFLDYLASLSFVEIKS